MAHYWHRVPVIVVSACGAEWVRIYLPFQKETKMQTVFGQFFSDGDWQCKVVLNDGHQRTIRRVCWSPCGNFLASCSFDATVCIWERVDGKWECTVNLEGHDNEVKCVEWSASGKYLATCSRDKTVWIWEVMEDNEYECASVQTVHSQDVKSVQWHPKLDICASCSYDNSIKLYKEDDDDWISYSSLESHESTVWSIAYNGAGDRLASCSDDKTIKIWQPRDDQQKEWSCICTLSGYHERPVYHVSWSGKNGMIATAAGDDTICIFKESSIVSEDNRKGQVNFDLVCRKQAAHGNDVNCVDWNPSEAELLASCGDDGTIKLWTVCEL